MTYEDIKKSLLKNKLYLPIIGFAIFAILFFIFSLIAYLSNEMKETEEEKIKNKNNGKLSHVFAVLGLVFLIVSLIILIVMKYKEYLDMKRHGNGTKSRIFDIERAIPIYKKNDTQENNKPETNTQ
jgi:Na+/H+ antiporter NhaC